MITYQQEYANQPLTSNMAAFLRISVHKHVMFHFPPFGVILHTHYRSSLNFETYKLDIVLKLWFIVYILLDNNTFQPLLSFVASYVFKIEVNID